MVLWIPMVYNHDEQGTPTPSNAWHCSSAGFQWVASQAGDNTRVKDMFACPSCLAHRRHDAQVNLQSGAHNITQQEKLSLS